MNKVDNWGKKGAAFLFIVPNKVDHLTEGGVVSDYIRNVCIDD